MSKKKHEIVGKIGYCENKDLPGMENIPGGHYVYVKRMDGLHCDLNIITSLEDKNRFVIPKKILQVKKGNTYPIPIYDSNFNRWSGVNLDTVKGVPVSKVQKVGIKSVKRRHKMFVGKFAK